MFEIIPAMDIYQGHVVRLMKGQYDAPILYHDNPCELMRQFYDRGARLLHLVDLSGAKTGEFCLMDTLRVAKRLGMSVQVGGGLRSLESVAQCLEVGADRVILSSKIFTDDSFIERLSKKPWKSRVFVSCDVNQNQVHTHGWTQSLGLTLNEAIEKLSVYGLTNMIITDISKDGMMQGINTAMYRTVSQAYPHMRIWAAGGVSSLEIIQQLQELRLGGCIVGRGIYESDEFRDEVFEQALFVQGQCHATH